MSDGPKRNLIASVLVFGLCAIAAALVWFASPLVTGQVEPWDAQGPFYLGSLLAIGIISGIIAPRRYLACWAGVYVGQFVGTLLSGPSGPLAPLGWFVFLPLISLVSLLGATLGAGVRVIVATMLKRRDTPQQ